MEEDRELIINIVYLPTKLPEYWSPIDAKEHLQILAWQARANLLRCSFDSIPGISDTDLIVVQRSNDIYSGWDYVCAITPSTTQFLDMYANNTAHLKGIEYYRFIVPSLKLMSSVVSSRGEADPYALEMSRRHHIQLSKGRSGNKCYVFTAMKNTMRCPECWDEIIQQRTKSDCNTCKNTGFMHGFHDPTVAYFSFSPESISIGAEVDGPSNLVAQQHAWTSNYPMLITGDIVVDAKNLDFWAVESVQPTTHKRVITKQTIVLKALQGDDPQRLLINRISEVL